MSIEKTSNNIKKEHIFCEKRQILLSYREIYFRISQNLESKVVYIASTESTLM